MLLADFKPKTQGVHMGLFCNLNLTPEKLAEERNRGNAYLTLYTAVEDTLQHYFHDIGFLERIYTPEQLDQELFADGLLSDFKLTWEEASLVRYLMQALFALFATQQGFVCNGTRVFEQMGLTQPEMELAYTRFGE